MTIPALTAPISVHRHDDEDGSIQYELHSAERLICVLDERENRYAREDARLIAEAVNRALV